MIFTPLGVKKAKKIEQALSRYGEDDLKRDFMTVFDRIRVACDHIKAGNLQSVISGGRHHNEISTIFAALFLAFFDLIIRRHMDVHDYTKLVESLGHLQVTTQRKAIDATKRRANINSIRGSIQDSFAEDDVRDIPLGKPLVFTFENSLRRSRIELPHYEFKQGLLSLDKDRKFNNGLMEEIVKTICGMANIEPNRDSFLYIGVTDKASDAKQIRALDSVNVIDFEGRSIVGVSREAAKMKCSLDDYVMRIKQKIEASALTEPLKSGVLSKLDCFVYKDLDILRIVVPGQSAMSFVGNECFDRSGSSTVNVSVQHIQYIARRFQ